MVQYLKKVYEEMIDEVTVEFITLKASNLKTPRKGGGLLMITPPTWSKQNSGWGASRRLIMTVYH